MLGVFKVAAQALVMTLVDDSGVLIVVAQTGVHVADRFGGQRDNFLELLLGYQQVVRCETDLPGIQRFANHDALNGLLDIG